MTAQNPIAAIDVSKWQGRINWDVVKANNPHIKLVAIKAGGGDNGIYPDVQFARNWAEAKRVGFDRFAYWFASPAQPMQYQFDFFSGQLSGDAGEYRPCIDVEAPSKAQSPMHLMSMMKLFELWFEQFGYWPTLYSAAWWWDPIFPYVTPAFAQAWAQRWTQIPCWVASYTKAPVLFEPFKTAAMWQYTDAGEVKGINGKVDLNWVYEDGRLRMPLRDAIKLKESPSAVWPDAPFTAKTIGTVIARANIRPEARELWRTVDGVEVEVMARANGFVRARIKSLEAWLPETQVRVEDAPVPPVVTPIAPVQPVRLGYNCLNAGLTMAKADAGCRFFMLMDIGVARAIKRKYPDAVVMVRWYHDKRVTADDIVRGLGPSLDDELVFTGLNECDWLCYGTIDQIRERAALDVAVAQRLKEQAPKSVYAAGTFSVGTPDYTSAGICEAIRQHYAPHYNSGLFSIDYHSYTPSLTNGFDVWYARRWVQLFEKCGFDVNSPSRIYSGETGVDDGAGRGFVGVGTTQAQVNEWATRYKILQAEPVNGRASPFVGGAVFALGSNGDGRWTPFQVDGYQEVFK